MSNSPLSTSFRARISAFILACTLVCALVVPSQALAVVGAQDSVGTVPYTQAGVTKELMPDVSMNSGILTTSDGRVLWSREPDMRHSIASITKLMTALVAVENGNLDDVVTVPKLSTQVGESTSNLKTGEKITLKDLLGALLVKSGNDAAITVAVHISGNTEEFVKLMNEKAAELGMTGTQFKNPHGLDAPGHYSTARDVSVMTRAAMSYPILKEIVGTKLYKIVDNKATHKLSNTNLLLWKYQGTNGAKTGWTGDAGYCLSAAAERNSIQLFAVTLGTTTDIARFNESAELLDFGFAHYRNQEIAVKNTIVGNARILDYPKKTVSVGIDEDVTIPIFDFAGEISRTYEIPEVHAPLKKGDSVGVAQYRQGDMMIATVPLTAQADVDKPPVLLRPFYAIAILWNKIFD